MSSMLYDLKGFIQNFIKTACSVIEIDINVMDSNLFRVAGTGPFKDSVGLSLPEGCANDYVLKSKKLLIMDNPLENQICQNCPIKATDGCYEEHMIISPIIFKNKVYGSITIAAINDEQKKIMQRKMDNLIEFLKKLVEVIINKISEKELSDRFNLIFNTINEGIVLVDHRGNILKYNKVLADICENYNNIKDILLLDDNNNLHDYINNVSNKEIEVELNNSTRSMKMYLNMKRINEENKKSDILFIFKHKKELDNLAYKLLADASHLNIDFDTIKGNSKLMNQTKKLAEQASKHNLNVLILGETGTGKELFARAIHRLSDRKNEPFITINCSAIPENLLESELFGYEEGAFTGAKKSGKPGKFELANKGTLFLDEIGDMSLYLQPKLLRIIEYGKLERIGGVKTIDLDVKIIAATNKDLEQMVEERKFRRDLFYRLCVFPIITPPLRKRPEDIIVIAEYFLKKYNQKFNKNIFKLTDDVKRELLLYNWPGNVRELENIIEYAVSVETGNVLTIDSIPNKGLINNIDQGELNINSTRKKHIEILLRKYGDSLKGKEMIAQELGISLSTLYRHIKKYKII